MALTHDSIANFIGGVSQQPDKLMFPNQAKELINMLPNPSLGLTRRYPTEHIAKLMNVLSVHPKCHTIVKEDEKYQVILTGTGIKVFDLEGNEKTVYAENALIPSYELNTYSYSYINRTATLKQKGLYTYTFKYTVGSYTVKCTTLRKVTDPATDSYVMNLSVGMELKNASNNKYFGTVTAVDTTNHTVTVRNETATNTEYSPLTYITTQTPLADLDVVTLGDYTFILNKTVKTEMYEELYPNDYVNAALVFIKQGNYAIDYKIKVNGSEVATKTTSSSAVTDIKTDAIASALHSQLETNLGTSNWNLQVKNSTILIQRKDKAAFTISTSDSNSDRNMYCFHDETDDLTLLPIIAPDGFILKVTGEDVNADDDYYVKFHTSDGTAFGAGYWQECPSPNCTYSIKAQTMPHVLIREADGTFTFKLNDWTERRCGDEDSAKTPSFIGNTIQEIASHKGRITLLTLDKSVYSDTEDVFAFFRKSALTKLDTDPIDINSNSKMVLLKHSLPFNNDLLLFSNTSEFTVTSGDVFSNSTVAIDLTMEYPCSTLCKPVNIGSTALFVHDNGDYSGVYEVYIASTYNTAARSITEQVPSYIPKNVYKIAASILHNVAIFPSITDRTNLYVYSSYYSSEQKAQSAWSRWQFENREILDIEFIENYLYLTVQYSDGVYLEKMNFAANQKENDNLNYIFYLDRKTTLTNGTYDSTTDKTAYTLPYPIGDDDDYVVVVQNGFSKVYSITENTIYVKGNTTTDTLTFGKLFTSYWELGDIYKRETTSTGATQVVEGLLMLKDVKLSYTDSCYFKARVVPDFTSQIVSEYEYTGIVAGTPSATMGIRNSYSGVFTVPVLAKCDEVDIEIINNSYFPSNFLSLEWLGDLCIRGNNN